jgi:uncharacterized protein YlzI (FlbEa/FlbD family)
MTQDKALVGVNRISTILLFLLVDFTRLDGHTVAINRDAVSSVQGAGQLGYPNGSLIHAGGDHIVVQENVLEVKRRLREAK